MNSGIVEHLGSHWIILRGYVKVGTCQCRDNTSNAKSVTKVAIGSMVEPLSSSCTFNNCFKALKFAIALKCDGLLAARSLTM